MGGTVSGWSIRTQLALLVLAAFVPLIGSIAYHFHHQAETHKRHAARAVAALAQNSAASLRVFLEDTRRMAELLAARPQIRAMDRARCDPLLRELYAVLPLHANASVLDRDGRFVCSARPLPDPAPVPVRHAAFENAMRGEAGLSEPVLGALSKRWIVAAAHPVKNAAGEVVGAATLTLDLARIGQLIASHIQHLDTLATVVSANGTVIARSADAEDWVGKRIDDVQLYKRIAAAGAGTMTDRGLDGVERIYGAANVGPEGWRVIVGIPSARLLAEARAEARAYLYLTAAVLVLFALAAALIARRLGKAILDMDAALKMRSAGDARIRIPERGPRELAKLAQDCNAALDAEQQTTARLAGIIESAMDGIITVNEKLEITHFNPAAEAMFGYRSAQVRGRPLNLLIPARFHASHDQHVRRFGETGVTSRAMGRLGEIAGLRANGEEFPIEASISQLATPRGKLFTVILRDVTSSKRVRDALVESERTLRLFVEHAPSAIAMFDCDMRYLAYSRRWLTDYRLGERDLTGRSHYDVFPDLPERWKDVHRRCLAGAVEKCEEDAFPRADGSLDWIRWEAHPWHGARGAIGGLIIFSEVITERKLAQEALRRSAEEMQDLALRLAEVEESERRNIHRELHDQVGANLSALKLDLGLISAMLPDDVRGRVNERLQRAMQVTGETIARIRNVMADLRPPALDDFGLLAALRMHADSVAARLRIPVEITGTDIEPRLAPAVETALFRIAQEALNNIAKHAHASRVDMAITDSGGRVTLTIADDGAGFDPALVDPARTNWGLRTMRERALAIGAALRVESAPGRGTRIRVDLPREAA
jgi:PAS domain S-box-containing protein